MDFARQIEANRRALLFDLARRWQAALDPFAYDLSVFLGELEESQLPTDWRARWHAFVAQQAAQGFAIAPESVREMETWIEQRGRRLEQMRREELRRRVADAARQIDSESVPTIPEATANKDSEEDDITLLDIGAELLGVPHAKRKIVARRQRQREQFFHRKLNDAQSCLVELRKVLEGVGEKLDAAEVDEEIDVDAEVEAVEELIFRYWDNIESAQGEWLRKELRSAVLSRRDAMLTPVSLGLPFCLEEGQAQRVIHQGLEISKRLGQANVAMDRLVLAMQAIEVAGNVAGVLCGVGTVYTAAKVGGRWAVVKLVVVAGVVAGLEKAAERGLRAAGADETVIRGAVLAAAVIGFILLRRRIKTQSNSAPAPASGRGNASGPKISTSEARRRGGIAFNKERAKHYPHNEVPIAKAGRGKPYMLDSYDPNKGEIVFRRKTQFSEIQLKTAQAYLREFVAKYPPGSQIPNVPSAGKLAGKTLKGQMIFEVPPQMKRIPAAILENATQLKILIRDTNGKIYNPH